MAEIIGRVGWRNYVSPISPLWNNLVAYWSGDNTANDSKGTYNGTLVNGTTYATGKINNGFSLDGVNDYVNFGNNLDFSGTTPFSFSVWVKPTALGEVNCILSKMVAATAQGYYLRLQNGIRFALYGIYPNGVVVTTTTPIPLNVFTHITLTYSGNGLGNGFKIYVNGVNTTLNIEANGFSGSSSNTAEFSLGSQYSGGSAGVFFQGIIDEVGAWSRALTAADAAELYNGGAGKQYVAPAPAYTARTAAFAAATGITDATILNALNTFDTGLISNGLDTDLEALYPFVGGTSTTHQYNFMNPINSDAAFRLTFNGGWIHSSTGAQPNGNNAYAKTWWNPATQITGTIDNGSFGFYIRQDLTVNGGQETLFCSNGSSYFGMWGGSNALYPSVNDGNNISFNPTVKKGFFQSSRTSTSNIISSVGAQQFSQTQNTNSKTNAWVSLGAWHEVRPGNDNYLSSFSSKEISMAYLSKGKYTQAQQSTFYTLVQAMQTSLSRQV